MKRLLIPATAMIALCAALLAWRARGTTTPPPPPPPRLPGVAVINAHEHVLDRRAAPRLLDAMNATGITTTVIAGGSTMTTLSARDVGFQGYDDNNEEMLAIARTWPGRFVPFVVIDPADGNNLERLEYWFRRGAKGVKLYSGHGSFHHLSEGGGRHLDRALDDPDMMPVYRWLADHDVPLLWHVNTEQYLDEFRRVLDRVPGLRVDCPHHCMSTERPDDLAALLRDYPTLRADLSHGFPVYMAEALRRLSENAGTFRALYERYPDRFFWGSDTVATLHPRKTAAWIEDMIGGYFGLFAAERFRLPVYNDAYEKLRDEWHPGFHLPPERLADFFAHNAERWLGVESEPSPASLEEIVAREDWSALYAYANRLPCSSDEPPDVRRTSAEVLRRVVLDPRVPARVALRLARSVPGLGCFDAADWARARGQRAREFVSAIGRSLDEELDRSAFAEIAVTLAELQGAELQLHDPARYAARLRVAVDEAWRARDWRQAQRALLDLRALEPHAADVAARLRWLDARLESSLVAARQAYYSELAGGMAVAVRSAAAQGDAIVLSLALRNRSDRALAVMPGQFSVRTAAGRSARGLFADDTALPPTIAAWGQGLVTLRFALAPDPQACLLTYDRATAGKRFVVTE